MKTVDTKNRYEHMFDQLRQQQKHALIPFTILGWPNPEVCLKSIDAFIAGGATALELGLAFSDPMADGPLIQKAARDTLDAGFKVDDAIELVHLIRQKYPAIPMSLLVYYNLVLARGVDQFFHDFGKAGLDAVLIADLPMERFEEIRVATQATGIQLTSIISPLTDEKRLPQIAANSGGFLYAVSRLGITGVEERYDQSLDHLIQSVRACTQLPVCVGFGISKREHVQQMVQLGADGVIIGSALIRQIQALAPDYPMASIQAYLQEMAQPIQ